MSAVRAIILSDVETVGFMRSAGPYRIATELEKHGYRTLVVPILLSLSLDELKRIIDRHVGDLLFIGVSSNFLHGNSLLQTLAATAGREINLSTVTPPSSWAHTDAFWDELRDHVRAQNPRCQFVCGGYQSQRRFWRFDYYIDSYADESVVALARHIDGVNDEDRLEFAPVRTGGVVAKLKQPSTFDFNSSHIDYEHLGIDREVVPVEVARGCIFSCAFCSYPLNGKSKLDYIRQWPCLERELRKHHDLLGSTDFMLVDDTLNESTIKIEGLKRIFDSLPFHLRFVSYLRLDLLHAHPEQIALLSGHVHSAFFGVESMNTLNGKIVGKGLAFQKQVETAWALREKWGCSMTASFIVGLPHDDPARIGDEMAEFLNGPNNPFDGWHISPLVLSPPSRNALWVSRFERDPGRYGYTFDDKGWRNTMSGMDRAGAVAISRDILRDTAHRNRYGVWTKAALSNIGISEAEQQAWPLKTDLVRPEFGLEERRQRIINMVKHRFF